MSGQPDIRLALRARLPAAMLATLVFAGVAAWAQNLKIPDFRQGPPVVNPVRPGEPCDVCGRILSIREVQVERKPSVPQAFQGGSVTGTSSGPGDPNLVGAVIYLPLGNNPGEKPFVGGVGTPEMRERFQDTTYEISVRLDDGAVRSLQRPDGTRYRVGDRVRLPGAGQIELLAE